MKNNKTIEILNGDKIVVNVNTFRHFINELIDRRIKGKGLSTNDFTNEDKTKLGSSLTSNSVISADKIGDTIDDGYTLGVIKANRLRGNLDNATISGSQVNGHLGNATIDASNVSGLADFIPTGGGDSTGIIEASRVSGDLVNATIKASKIIDYGGQGTLMTGVICGTRIQGLLINAYVYGSSVSGNLTNANIDVERVNNLNDIIGSHSNGTFIYYQVNADKVRGNLDNATIRGSSIIGSIDASRIQGNLADAKIQGSNITGYIDVSKLQDTINNVVTVGKINAANISGKFLNNISILASTIQGELTNATVKTTHLIGNILGDRIRGTISGSIITGTLTNADILFDNLVMGSTKLPGQYITGNIDASLISGKLINATIDAGNVDRNLTLGDYSITSTHLATGAVLPENIASGNLQSGVIVNARQISGNINGDKITGTISGAFLDANKIFETNETGVVMGTLNAGRLQGNIDKERMRSGFLELCAEYGVAFNSTGGGTD